jgi:hypothetical protein
MQRRCRLLVEYEDGTFSVCEDDSQSLIRSRVQRDERVTVCWDWVDDDYAFQSDHVSD